MSLNNLATQKMIENILDGTTVPEKANKLSFSGGVIPFPYILKTVYRLNAAGLYPK